MCLNQQSNSGSFGEVALRYNTGSLENAAVGIKLF